MKTIIAFAIAKCVLGLLPVTIIMGIKTIYIIPPMVAARIEVPSLYVLRITCIYVVVLVALAVDAPPPTL